MGVFVSVLVNALKNASNAGNPNESFTVALSTFKAYVATSITTIARWIGALVFSANQEQGAWKGSVGRGAGIGNDVATVAADNEAAWTHMLNTVLPTSLAKLAAELAITDIGAIRKRLKAAEDAIKSIRTYDAGVTTWRNKTVSPVLSSYLAFWKYYNGKPKSAVDQWVSWFAKPAEFSSWAINSIVPALIAYLHDTSHKTDLDALTGQFVTATPDVAHAVEAACVAILNTEW